MVKEPHGPSQHRDTPEQLAASPRTITSASVGTVLVSGAGAMTPLTMNQPTAASTDDLTPLTLVDAAAAPSPFAPPPKVLFSASLRALACEYDPKPGVPLTPGITAPTWPKTLTTISIPFSLGLYVLSCPANMTFTATA